MKRYICLLVAIMLLLLTGCDFPFFGSTDDKQSSAASSTANTDPFADRDAGQASAADKTGVLAAETQSGQEAAQQGQTTAQQGQTTAQAGVSNNGIAAGSSAQGDGAASSVTSGEPFDVNGSEENQGASTTAKLAVTVYYQDAEGYLIPTARWIEKQQGIARAAVSALVDSAISREEIQYYGLYPVLPENTDILGIDVKDGLAVIDFNTKLLNYRDKNAERNIIASIVYTLTEFDTIKNVRILVNGFPQQILKYGTDISGVLNRDNVMINTRGALNGSKPKGDIYCLKKANEGFTYVLPVSFELIGEDSTQAEFASQSPDVLVRLLLANHPGDPLQSEIPEGAALKDYTVKDGNLTLDLDSKFVSYGGNSREEGILKQLMYTVRQVRGIKRVYLQVDGNKAQLPEGTDIANGLAVPRTVNDVIDR